MFINQHDTVSEWLRRWTRNPLGFARKGSNPFGVDVLQSSVAHIVSASHKTKTNAKVSLIVVKGL